MDCSDSRGRQCTAAHSDNPRAFTLIDMLVVITIVATAFVLVIPSLLRHARQEVYSEACSSNLSQIGLAFRTWAVDHGDRNPAMVPTNAGGVKELVGTGQVFIHFQALSNQLSTPKLLVCPDDKTKAIATSFASAMSDKNVSYFVGTDANETLPHMLLSGDRNLSFKGRPIKPGLFVLSTNAPSLGWTEALHEGWDHIAFSDGAVMRPGSAKLADAARNQGLATNRLAIP